ncbi:MAG: histidine phosphatase family protein [Actinomycetota bacterium]
MQLLLIRHGKPQLVDSEDGSDPNLSYDGNEQARRLPDALSKFSLARIVSSPQRRALQTAAPVADQLGMTVETDARLAEYDLGLPDHTPVEQAADDPASAAGRLPGEVDEKAFVERVRAAIDDVVAAGGPDETVAIFTHGGVINAVVHSVMKTQNLLCAQVDYAGLTRLSVSDGGDLSVASVNVTDHVWDLLYRTQWWSEEH